MTANINEQRELMKSTEAMVLKRAELVKLYEDVQDELHTLEDALSAPLDRLGELMGIPSDTVLEDLEMNLKGA